jgi:N-carbamoyl-L-amino-acid hydrolase
MKESGLEVHVDPFGNIIGQIEGIPHDNHPPVVCGSHIDTVPNGGRLDGAYGVLSGIEAIRTILERDVSIKKPLEIAVFAEEEGVRFYSFLGSLGFIGAIRPEEAHAIRDDKGIPFGRAIVDAGLNLRSLRPCHEIPPEIAAYVELHIEQGPILERERISIGVVDWIVGLGKLEVELQGVAGHAGTMPMSLRHDALLGASQVILGVNKTARRKTGSVATVGSLSACPNVSNVIPGNVTLTVDFRDRTGQGLRTLQERIVRLIKHIAKENRLKIRVSRKSFTKPAGMSPRIMGAISSSARSLGLAHTRITSGAGHDCQNIRRIAEAGMIFVPSHAGVSHAFSESTKPEHLEAGANVLLNTLLRLANE